MYYDRKVWEFIRKNKPTANRSIELVVELFLGYLKDGNTWYSVDEYSAMDGALPMPWKNIIVTILMDDIVIYTGNPVDRLTVTQTFQDSNDAENRVFKIKVQGFTHEHVMQWPGTDQSGGAALNVLGHIGNIPLQLLMPKFGKYVTDDGTTNVATDILCQNGCQDLCITTPFYTWLHQRQELLFWELADKKWHL